MAILRTIVDLDLASDQTPATREALAERIKGFVQGTLTETMFGDDATAKSLRAWTHVHVSAGSCADEENCGVCHDHAEDELQ